MIGFGLFVCLRVMVIASFSDLGFKEMSGTVPHAPVLLPEEQADAACSTAGRADVTSGRADVSVGGDGVHSPDVNGVHPPVVPRETVVTGLRTTDVALAPSGLQTTYVDAHASNLESTHTLEADVSKCQHTSTVPHASSSDALTTAVTPQSLGDGARADVNAKPTERVSV